MRRFFPFIALLALVAMVGCSGNSPSPQPIPTVAPEAWAITSLQASSTGPFVNTVILVEADVAKNGSPAPDGTKVTFQASGGAFSNGTAEASVITSSGSSSVAFVSDTAGSYSIRALVKGVSDTIVVTYQDRATTDQLQLFGIDPRRGSYGGGEQATITGKGILAPVDVYFDLNGVGYQAIVAGVVESDPLSDEGSVTVITPAFTGVDTSVQQTADVRVITNAGTGGQETDTLSDAFALVPGGGPAIFGVSPNTGRSSGGEVVSILGQGFGTVASDLSVSFTEDNGVVRLGSVLAVAPDGSQIQVETPIFSTLPLEGDIPMDVTVATIDGSVTLEDAFIVLADNPQPTIATISPTAGPEDGGTLVTIFGQGFQVPMQVWFGNLTALDVNVFNDTSPAGNDRITCVTPDYSQQGEVPPVAVDVTVTNMTSGNTDTLDGAFTYGDPLYITGNSPVEGGLGDLVIIYGSGFEDPLQVFLGGELMELVSVTGTELVIRIPDDLATSCSGTAGAFEVVLLESGQSATGGTFNILGNSPTVLSVSPIILQQIVGPPEGVDPNDITITGQDFSDEVLVSIGSYIPPTSDVERTAETNIDVYDLPGVNELGITFDTVDCTMPSGAPGQRSASTPISVTVTNFPGNCPDTLNGAIIVEPAASNCTELPPVMAVSESSLAFGDAADGTQLTFTISNTGGGQVNWTIAETDLDGVFTVNPTQGFVEWDALIPSTVTVTFNHAGGPGNHTGSLTITAIGAEGSPATVTLSATTPTPP